MNLPPPRPGYRRDADPEGRWDETEGDEIETTTVTTKVAYEWNIPLIATLLGFLFFGLPLSILLWGVALSWL